MRATCITPNAPARVLPITLARGSAPCRSVGSAAEPQDSVASTDSVIFARLGFEMHRRSLKAVVEPNAQHDPHTPWSRIAPMSGQCGQRSRASKCEGGVASSLGPPQSRPLLAQNSDAARGALRDEELGEGEMALVHGEEQRRVLSKRPDSLQKTTSLLCFCLTYP